MSELTLKKAQEIVAEKNGFIDAGLFESLVDAQDVVITHLTQKLKEAKAAAVKWTLVALANDISHCEQGSMFLGLTIKDRRLAAETIKKFGGLDVQR